MSYTIINPADESVVQSVEHLDLEATDAAIARAALAQRAEERAATEASVHYAGCDEVRLLGKAPLYSGQPGYSSDMDGDGDGIACEPRY